MLYLTLGFRQFSHYFTDIRKALDHGDEVEARRLLSEWRHLDASELPASELLRHVIEHSLLAAHRHVFGVFFWFVLLSTFGLGPAGAVLYRMAELASRYWSFKSGDGAIAVNETLMQLSQRLFHLLDHVPARLTASGFAVVGNFEEAVNCWRRDASLWKYDNEGVILAAAAGAVGVSLGGGSAPGLTPGPGQDLHRRRLAGVGRRLGLDAGRDAAARAPAQRRRPGLALGRALDAAAGAALARPPDRLSQRPAVGRLQLGQDLAVDAVARLGDLAPLQRRQHAAARLVLVAAVVEAAFARRAGRCRASARRARSTRCGAGRIPGSPANRSGRSAARRSIQYQCVAVVVCRPVLSAWEISPTCALASATSRLTSVLLPAPLGPRTSVARPASSGASRSRAGPGSFFKATPITSMPIAA